MKSLSAFAAWTLLSLSLLASAPANAQRSGVANGNGLDVCERLLSTMQGDHVAGAYTQWVIGYLSAYNLFGEQKQLESIPDEAGIDSYLQKYCRDNPLDKVIWASMALISDLGGYRPPYMKK